MTEPDKKRRGSLWIYLSSILVVGLGIWVILQGKAIPLDELRASLARFQLKWVWLALGCICVQVFWQIARLWILVPPGDYVGFRRISQLFVWGQFINSFAPARAGDFVKAVSLASKKHGSHVSLPEAAGVLIADKIVDAVSLFLLCFLAGASSLSDLPKLPAIPWRPMALGGGALLLIIGVILAAVPTVRLKLRTGLSKVQAGAKSFFKNPIRLALALGFSLLCWTFESLAVASLCQGQGTPIFFRDAVFVLLTLNIGVAIPIAIANIGAFEASMTFGLTRVGLQAAGGLAVATVHHAFQIAGIAIWLLGLSVLRLIVPEKKPPSDPPLA